jgi:hypothetical protein
MKDKEKLTNEEFIIKSNIIHNNFYDYSKIIYKNNKTKVIVVCPSHVILKLHLTTI